MTVQRKRESAKPLEHADQGADPVVAEAIGKQLKRLYDHVAHAPVPDRFSDLLERLEKADRDKS